MTTPSLLSEIQRYAAAGLRVLPVRERTEGETRAKQPYTAHGFHDATADHETIRQWWHRWPGAAVGFVTGTEDGLVVIDLDIKGDVNGIATWQELAERHGGVPRTREVRTPSGGRHLYFTVPSGQGGKLKSSAGKLGPGIDVRASGGYIVAPPSRIEAGSYEWADRSIPIAQAPPWLVKLIQAEPKERKPAPAVVATEGTAYGLAALEDECRAVAKAPEGGRNHRLNEAAFAVGQLVAGGQLTEAEALTALEESADACGLGQVESQKTIESGFRAGLLEPRTAPVQAEPVGESEQKAGKTAAKEARAQECKAGIFNGAALLEMDLPEVRWAVPGLLPQGLAILAGGPKLGKSWLIYSICAGIGAGCNILGQFQTPQARSLYLALEDGQRRLQDRLKALCNTDPAIKAGLSNVDFQITWPRFDDEGGLEKLEEYIKENVPGGLKLVVVDTLAKVMPKGKSKGLNAYENDSLIMGRIKSMADRHGVCVLIVTHLSKLRTSKDPFDSITGSMGQFGTADTAMLLTRKRGAPTATLQTTGRDIEGNSYALSWSNPGWTCAGLANEEELGLSAERLAILNVFRAHTEPISSGMVARETGKTVSNTSKLIKKLVEEGFLFSSGYGLYSVQSGQSIQGGKSVQSVQCGSLNSLNSFLSVPMGDEVEL